MTEHATAALVEGQHLTRAQRAALPLTTEVAQHLAEQHGVRGRPLAMRRITTTTGQVDVVPVPCGSTREDQCRPCADKARRLRMAQCREGWAALRFPDCCSVGYFMLRAALSTKFASGRPTVLSDQ